MRTRCSADSREIPISRMVNRSGRISFAAMIASTTIASGMPTSFGVVGAPTSRRASRISRQFPPCRYSDDRPDPARLPVEGSSRRQPLQGVPELVLPAGTRPGRAGDAHRHPRGDKGFCHEPGALLLAWPDRLCVLHQELGGHSGEGDGVLADRLPPQPVGKLPVEAGGVVREDVGVASGEKPVGARAIRPVSATIAIGVGLERDAPHRPSGQRPGQRRSVVGGCRGHADELPVEVVGDDLCGVDHPATPTPMMKSLPAAACSASRITSMLMVLATNGSRHARTGERSPAHRQCHGMGPGDDEHGFAKAEVGADCRKMGQHLVAHRRSARAASTGTSPCLSASARCTIRAHLDQTMIRDFIYKYYIDPIVYGQPYNIVDTLTYAPCPDPRPLPDLPVALALESSRWTAGSFSLRSLRGPGGSCGGRGYRDDQSAMATS